MSSNGFWLFYFEDNSIIVSLISYANNRYFVNSIGSQIEFNINNLDSIIEAADKSLSDAAEKINLPPESEPETAGLVLPSHWIGIDGKILPHKTTLIFPLLKKLDLQATGFIPNDEAIVEESNKKDSFPSSFISLFIDKQSFTISLAYLGKIKRRIKKDFDTDFNPQLVENAILELNSESTLPPQIVVHGQIDQSIIEQLKSFPWVGKKDVETFLHFPEIKFLNYSDLINIFFKAITSQTIPDEEINSEPSLSLDKEEVVVDQEQEPELELEPKSEILEDNTSLDTPTNTEDELEEVDPSFLGFSSQPNLPPEPIIETKLPQITIDQLPQNYETVIEDQPVENKPSFSFKIPKINFKLPKIKTNKIIFLPIILFLAVLTILFFSKTNIIVFLTPYEFNKKISLTLDSTASDINSKTIPVDKKTITINSSANISTTGKKTIGEKATGEITIFNKLDKSQTLPKGTILISSDNKQFELINQVTVPSSSSDLNLGVITLGQSKTSVSAKDIGPEYNLNKDTQLSFKDFPQTSLVAKISQNLSGGTKQDIAAVSEQDKTNVEAQLAKNMETSINQRVEQEITNSTDLIKSTIQTKNSKTELNREVGEEANELTATIESTITVFGLKTDSKDKIIKYFLASEDGFSKSDINAKDFSLDFKLNKITADNATGDLTIAGKSLPKIDTNQLQKKLILKTSKQISSFIKTSIPRAYNFNVKMVPEFIPISPINSKNIFIQIKTESL